jgi:hypothetical protein
VELEQFHQAGIDNTQLRLLIRLGHAQLGVERTARTATRRFQQPASLAFPDRSCLVLIPSGLEAARSLGLTAEGVAALQPALPPATEPNGRLLPNFDRQTR